jgi:hypothetical protein
MISNDDYIDDAFDDEVGGDDDDDVVNDVSDVVRVVTL